jgi:hypothetical protein
MTTLQSISADLEALKADFIKHIEDFHMSDVTSQTIATVTQDAAEGVQVAGTIASDVQSAVASQTTLLGKIDSALSEFLSLAPSVATAINPGAGAVVTGIAASLQGLLGVLSAFHSTNVVPKVAAATAPAPVTVQPTAS